MGMRIDTKKVVNEGEVSSYHPNPGSVLAQSFDQVSSGNEFQFDFFRIDDVSMRTKKHTKITTFFRILPLLFIYNILSAICSKIKQFLSSICERLFPMLYLTL